MRTFQLHDRSGRRWFCNVTVEGDTFTVTHTPGVSRARQFPSATLAQAAAEKYIAKKLAKGYVETTPRPPASLREALEAALVADPDDVAAHMAYADHLQELGDPRGEFIQVQLALEDEGRPAAERKKLQKREKELLKAHEREWLGELAPILLDYPGTEDWRLGLYGQERFAEFQFRRGWLDRLYLNYLSLPTGRALREARVCRMVRDLAITSAEDTDTPHQPGDGIPPEHEREYPAGLWPLSQSPFLANVRYFRLGVDDGDDWEGYSCHMHTAAVVPLVRAMPRLEELRLFANRFRSADLFALPTLTHLRVLQWHHGLGIHRLQVLAENAACRNLTHLLLHPHNYHAWWENPDDDDGAGYRADEGFLPLSVVGPLLHSPNLPNLAHLRLRCSSMGDDGCREIVRSGILRRLKSLDLRHGCITDEGARALCDCPDLRHLEWLDLDRNALTAAGIKIVKATGIPVRVENQQTATEVNDREYLREGEFE
jgi:uncharacterized protein (TIGR02996 family)